MNEGMPRQALHDRCGRCTLGCFDKLGKTVDIAFTVSKDQGSFARAQHLLHLHTHGSPDMDDF